MANRSEVNPGNKRCAGDGKGRQGGRKKGEPNKKTSEIRSLIALLLQSRWDEFLAAYDAIESPKDKCYVTIGLLQYAAPKMAMIEYKGDVPAKTLADELDEISGEKTRK